MGMDLIIMRKNGAPDSSFITEQSGHRFIVDTLDQLNQLAETIGCRPLEDFADYSDMEEEFYEEIHGEAALEDLGDKQRQWFEPTEALAALTPLIAHLTIDSLPALAAEDKAHLLEDLKDCRDILEQLVKEGDLFCFSLIY